MSTTQRTAGYRPSKRQPIYRPDRKAWYVRIGRGRSQRRLASDIAPEIDANGKPIPSAEVRRACDIAVGRTAPPELAGVDGVQEFSASGPCVYYLSFAGRIVHIGQTRNLARRVYQHANGKTKDGIVKIFDRVYFVSCNSDGEAMRLEVEYIRRFNPPLNKQAG